MKVKKMFNSKLYIVAVLLGLFGLSACNTVAGVGDDVEAAGDAVSDSAKENKTY